MSVYVLAVSVFFLTENHVLPNKCRNQIIGAGNEDIKGPKGK